MSLLKQTPERCVCVMLASTLTQTLALTVVLCCGWHVFVTAAREMVLCAAAQTGSSHTR